MCTSSQLFSVQFVADFQASSLQGRAYPKEGTPVRILDFCRILRRIHRRACMTQNFKLNSSLLDQGLPKGGNYSEHTASAPREDARRCGMGCVFVVWSVCVCVCVCVCEPSVRGSERESPQPARDLAAPFRVCALSPIIVSAANLSKVATSALRSVARVGHDPSSRSSAACQNFDNRGLLAAASALSEIC